MFAVCRSSCCFAVVCLFSRSLLNVFTLNTAISVPTPQSLPNCPLSCQIVHFRAILSISVLPSSFLLPSSIASGFYPDIGSRSRPILHRLPSLLSFVRPPSSSLLLSNPRSCFREHSLPISSMYAYSGLSLPKMAYSCK